MNRRVAGIACILIALTGLTWLIAGYVTGGVSQTADATRYERASVGDPSMRRLLRAAEQYNRTHPFDPKDGAGDADYRKQLDKPDDIMATVDYPRLSIRLAVRHGTTSSVLSSGAGHLPGTSLPVGGKGTRTVITGHRGGTTPLFTRLGEARKGDIFHLTAAGRTLAYKVVSIRVIQPDDLDALKPVAGRDLATLLTCTPYGVNTRRLLVTGTRTSMPSSASQPRDPVPTLAIGLLVAFWAAGGIVIFKTGRGKRSARRLPRARHRA